MIYMPYPIDISKIIMGNNFDEIIELLEKILMKIGLNYEFRNLPVQPFPSMFTPTEFIPNGNVIFLMHKRAFDL